MKRTALQSRRARLKPKRTEPRRTRHPLPLPTGKPVALDEVEGEAFAFGPQSDLCERTECAACFAVRCWRQGWKRGGALPWHLLATGTEKVSIAHHEPHRSTTCGSHDEDTYPLCRGHHTDGVHDCVRHRLRSNATDMAQFYRLLPFDWRAVVAEMQRRTKSLPAVETAEGTP